jgi:hypothetical protein
MVTSSTTRTLADDVRELDEFFAVLVAKIDPDAVPLCEVTDLYSALEVVKRRAESTMLLLARRVEDAGRWKRDGHRSAADQLAGISGTSVGAAKNQLETSKKVAKLPATAKALRKGKLSVAKAEAIAAAAAVAPEAEADLLDGAADAPLSDVRRKCLRARGKDRDAAHARIHNARSFKQFTDAEGAWNVIARGTADAGAAFRAQHQRIVDEMFEAARAAGRHEPYEAHAFDAFIELARRAGRTDTEGEVKAKPVQNFGLLRIDYDAFVRGSVEGEETCELPGLGPVPVRIARQLLGDAILKLVITKGVDVLNVTHLGRSATVAQQVALWWQSPGCRVEGCGHTFRLENDHRNDWAFTHKTRLDGLDPLCRRHHDLKTRHGWALVEGTGPRPMVPPPDPRHPKNKPPPQT